MYAAVRNSWPLLLGLGLLMVGNGLQISLVGIRASLEGFPAAVTGLVMSGYYLGFLVGSIITPMILANVGHVRVFAALASLASSAALIYVVFVDPIVWGFMRLLTGFAFAGLYIVCESWLNDAATNKTRGQLLSVYMIIMMGGMAGGQLFLNLADPGGYTLFIFISVLISVALIPMALTANAAPNFTASARLKLKELYKISPLGIVGMFAQGVTGGAFYGLAAVYGDNIGLSVAQISSFISVMIMGGVILQWPVGRLSDRFDRRMILMVTTMLSGAAAILALYAGETGSFLLFLLSVGLFGGFSVPLYSLCIAHTNDHIEVDKMVAASSGLILVNGCGAIFGPIIVGPLMSLMGSYVFFGWLAIGHIAIGLFAIYRMYKSPAMPMDEQGAFVAMPVRAGAAVATLNPETEEWINDEPPAYSEGEGDENEPAKEDPEATDLQDCGPSLGPNNP
ncbi:MAG: MFS transporter [Sneathiella sp.]|uniref:MFS transporter n=1 Tax=Sneathiella sp. TaxID=1964365 RepID=UPI000C51A2C0|nr:MFS transporter [Sneathiella sp.]MAZ02714.1 MFS transporter [Sneathiella sp.]